MKVTYYSKYSSNGPSSRYRAFQYVDLLKKQGIDLHISTLFNDQYFQILRSDSIVRPLKKIPYTLARFQHRKTELQGNNADLVVVEQQLFPYLPFAIEKQYLPARYLLEFDDAIFLTHPSKLPRMIAHATAVIAGNETLLEYARKYQEKVHVVPTALDTAKFRATPRSPSDKIVIGWSGLEYNYPYLNLIAPVLRKVSTKRNVEICILSGSPPKHFDFPFRFERWDGETEVEQLNQFDIGLMPLGMDEWSKGKCGFKLLQYMSLEIPSIATPIGVNESIVQDGVNGFLARDLSEWEARIQLLLEDAGLRKRIGQAARATIIEHYSTEVWLPKIAAIYRKYGEK